MSFASGALADYRLIVFPDKLRLYLLDPSHREGRHKAAFFSLFGFSIANQRDLEAALLEHARHAQSSVVVSPHPRGFGNAIQITGPLASPSGRLVTILSVWSQPDMSVREANFVTAYPA